MPQKVKRVALYLTPAQHTFLVKLAGEQGMAKAIRAALAKMYGHNWPADDVQHGGPRPRPSSSKSDGQECP